MDNSINTARTAASSVVKASQPIKQTLKPASIDLAPAFNAEVAKVASDVNITKPAVVRRDEPAARVAETRRGRDAEVVNQLKPAFVADVRAEAIARNPQQPAASGPSMTEQLRAAFQAVDGDGNKTITKDELISYLTQQNNSILNNQNLSAEQKGIDTLKLQQVMNVFDMFSVEGKIGQVEMAKIAQFANDYFAGVDLRA